LFFLNVSFDNEGKGAPAIILIHGWSNTKDIWDTQVEYLSSSYQVIAVDLPGFGESGNNRKDWSMASFGRDISNIIEQLELNKVVLVGFSMGAPVAIEAALASAKQVAGVVIVDDLQEPEMQIPPSMAHFMDSLMMDLVTYPSKEKIIGGGFVKQDVDAAYLRILSFLEDYPSRVGWRESLAAYMQWQNEDCTNSIQSLKSPIIAINSDMRATNTEAFRKYAPSFKAHIVKDVGHVIMWDDSEKFNQLLEKSIGEFLKE
jgi:pimeloyl-ACP methyl ester carboxylesterase